MGKHYRYRLPRWLIQFICILERAIVALVIFQLIRTLIFTTTVDLIILCLLVGLFIVFYVELL